MFVAPDLPDKVDTTGFANTMMALQDPAGALSRKQNEQIAETTAGMTLDGLQGDLLNAGFRDWDNYKTKYKGYLSSNKGFTRMRLNEQQTAEMTRERQKLSANLAWGKKAQQNYIDVMKQARADVGEGKIDQAELQAFQDKWTDLVKNNKGGLGDIPMPQALYDNMVHPKVKPEDLIKKRVESLNYLNAGQPQDVSKFDENVYKTKAEQMKSMGYPEKDIPTIEEAKASIKNPDKSLTEYQDKMMGLSERRMNITERRLADAEDKEKNRQQGELIQQDYDADGNVMWDMGGAKPADTRWKGHLDSKDGTKGIPVSGNITDVKVIDGVPMATINIQYKDKTAVKSAVIHRALNEEDKKKYGKLLEDFDKYKTQKPEVKDPAGILNKGGGKTYTINGEPFTEKELKSKGWTDEQLKKLK